MVMGENGMEQGLAQQQAMAGSGAPAGAGNVTIEDLVKLLLQGISPQELVNAGVPAELVQQAIDMAKQMMAQQGQGGMEGSQADMQQDAGLAGQMGGRM